MRLIDAGALREQMDAYSSRTIYKSHALKDIDCAPTIDAVPVVHGRWVDNQLNGYKWSFSCSECGWIDGFPFNERHSFCPSCGARMDGEEATHE